MKKHLFTFTEVISGSIEIESELTPTQEEIINAILDGHAHYKNTEFENIRLVEPEIKPLQKNRGRAKGYSR